MNRKTIVIPSVLSDEGEVEIVKWYVEEDARIKPDTLLAELLIEKATVEFRSEDSGKIVQILKAEGEVVKVGETVLIIESDD
jgi:pyruvate dehydrogenase E2 component (dihydrolipoamide acetyltransferase)